MKNTITNDGSFSRFQQRELMLGTETVSVTEYNCFEIQIRTYNGISAKIYGRKNGKRILLREKNFVYHLASDLIQKQKNYIDEFEKSLNQKLENKKL